MAEQYSGCNAGYDDGLHLIPQPGEPAMMEGQAPLSHAPTVTVARVASNVTATDESAESALSISFLPLMYLFDVLLLWSLFFNSIYMVGLMTLRLSKCPDLIYYTHPLGRKPKSQALLNDPWFADYPCGRPMDWGAFPVGLVFNLRHMCHTLLDPNTNKWMEHNWLWAAPLLSARHNMHESGLFLCLIPLASVLPLLAPTWWYRSGGRSKVMLLVKLAAPVSMCLHILLGFHDVQRVHFVDIGPPLHFGFLAALRSGLSGMLTWPDQLYGDLLMLGIALVTALARHNYSPSADWFTQFAAGCLLGGLMSTLTSRFIMQPFLLPALNAWRVTLDWRKPPSAAARYSPQLMSVVLHCWIRFCEWMLTPAVVIALLNTCVFMLCEYWFDTDLMMLIL